ncbi:MAG: peroxidase-related enzyme [Silicimonas sp.]|nr:peroxidase-related enzyme [Silicimonas sp.]
MKRLFPSLPNDATLGDVYRAFPAHLAPLAAYHNTLMRGDSPLTPAERELIAAYISGLNACAFCHGAHTTMARAFGIDPVVIEALMADFETAPVDPRLKPLLAYVGKLTRDPARMVEADAQEVYDAGWSEQALFDAIQVCGLFNLMNRMLEGTGIESYPRDPGAVDESVLEAIRSPTSYLDFARMNGLDV